MMPHESSYYPPRRTWWRRCVVNPLIGARQEWLGAWVERWVGMPILRSLAVVIIPGYALSQLPWPRIRMGWWAAYLICVLIAVAWLGHGVSQLGMGLMVGLHVSAALALFTRTGVRLSGWAALWMPIVLLTGVVLSVYGPMASLVFDRLFLALHTPKGIVVVNCASRPNSVRRGDTIAYHLQTIDGQWIQPGIWVREGLGLGRVLAVGGDRVEFDSEHFWVQGIAFPKASNMPPHGEVLVREGHWFIWPEFDRQGGRVAQEVLTAGLLRMASVPQSNFVGKPFSSWCGRRQPQL